MIDTKNIEEARKLIKKYEKPILVKAQDFEFNRKILEYGNFDVIVGIEDFNETGKVRGLNSGLNHVLAKIAAKNKIGFGIDFNFLRSLEQEKLAEILARISQNIRVCRKAKAKIVCCNFRDSRSAAALLRVLGASSQQGADSVKEAIVF